MVELRRAEVRLASGRRLVGVPMRYGAEARVRHPSGVEVTEKVAPFAFHEHVASGKPTTLNLMHDKTIVIASTKPGDRGRLELRDTPDRLSMAAYLPTGDVFDDVLKLVEDGSTAELSVEMRVQDEALVGDRRTVRRADLPAIGVVDAGAYRGQVEVRARGRGVYGRVDYRKDRVISNRGRVRKQRITPAAFSYNMDRWNSLQLEMNAAIERGIEQGVRDAIQDRVDLSPDITLLAGVKYDGAIASMKARSVTFTDTSSALEFDAPDITGTEAGRQLLARIESGQLSMGVVPLFALPPVDAIDGPVLTIEPEPGNPEVDVEVVHEALLTAIAIVNRAPLGNPGLIEVRHDLVEQDEPPPPPRRMLTWL